MINVFIILIVYLSIYLKINTEITEGKYVTIKNLGKDVKSCLNE